MDGCKKTKNSNLDLWPFNPKTMSLLGYPSVISYIKFEYFWIIRFWVMLRANKQTNKQTVSNVLPMPTDRVSMGLYEVHDKPWLMTLAAISWTGKMTTMLSVTNCNVMSPQTRRRRRSNRLSIFQSVCAMSSPSTCSLLAYWYSIWPSVCDIAWRQSSCWWRVQVRRAVDNARPHHYSSTSAAAARSYGNVTFLGAVVL